MSSATCPCHPKSNNKVKGSTAELKTVGVISPYTLNIFLSTAVGEKSMKDIRPGVPFEPTYIYKLLTLIKSSLSEKVSCAACRF